MKSNLAKKRIESINLINELIEAHRRFQEYLDLTTASNFKLEDIEALIEIRKFNINAISKYTDLVSEHPQNLFPLALKNALYYNAHLSENVMWEINSRLSRFAPVYTRVLKSKNINSITRMIIAQNWEKIVEMQENLIHPISEDRLYVLD